MYDIYLTDGEEIKLIENSALINNEKMYTVIITNYNLYILDIPSKIHNSNEDLRISGKLNYIKKKEVIYKNSLLNINTITKNRITFKDNTHLNINSKSVINKLNDILNSN